MSAAEVVFDYFEDHTRSADSVRHSRPAALGLLCFALTGVSVFMAQAVLGRLAPFSLSVTSMVLMAIWEIVLGLAFTAMLHLVMEFEGIQGSAASLFALMGLASLVWALTVPLALILRLVAPGNGWLATAAFTLVGLLSLGYKARSIQDNYQVGAARAWITLFVPYAAVVVAALLVFAVAMVTMFRQILQWVS
ncbi:MAG: hypothetical protein HY924_13040 [Elusimicrobia bacterium]|nr:hypothetical protein [Elusimicrobiota bacterium]